jgi:hypothetical protein
MNSAVEQSNLDLTDNSYAWLQRRGVQAFLVLLFTFITHLPTYYGDFSTDDYLIWANSHGSASLFAKGFELANPDDTLIENLHHTFHFFHPDADTTEFYKAYGNLPWWSESDAAMTPFRPLAALTHHLDFTFFADNLALYRAHNLFSLFLFAWLALQLYRKLSPSSSVALIATLLLIADFSLTRNASWIAARNSYMACALGIACLYCFVTAIEAKRGSLYVGSLALFLVGLLTAEATVMGQRIRALAERNPDSPVKIMNDITWGYFMRTIFSVFHFYHPLLKLICFNLL